ncbi:DNA oxidative demethylase ALKBH2 [Bienertia sinuspersici]
MAEKARAGRKSHSSTADLLTWTESPPSDSPAPSSASRSHQPSDAVSKVLFGGQITEEEALSLAKRKPCSGYKMKEMTGSGIFADSGDDDASESGSANPNKTGVRTYQQTLNGISQISFSVDESVTPKKPITLPEVAKQRELSGTLEAESDAKTKKHLSDAKCKELSGNDIFGPPPENPPRSLAAARSLESKEKDMGEPAPRTVRTSVKPAGGQSNIMFGDDPSVKTTRKLHNQKFQELTGNDIFKGDAPAGSAEKPLSQAKLREMSGSDIFAEGERVEPRDYFGGVRKPPGGESSIALV